MSFYRKVTNSDVLAKVIDLPESLQNKKVEILVLPYDDEQLRSQKNTARGLLEKYKNQKLRDQEQGAWNRAVKEKYEDR